MTIRNCSHMYAANRCPDSSCVNFDRRDLATQLFGPGGSNSELAARLYRTNKAAYTAARQEAVLRGWLPKDISIRCLQDD
jgi:hypothetical protein